VRKKRGHSKNFSGGMNRAREAPRKSSGQSYQPPLAPALQRARVDLQYSPDAADPFGVQAINHHRDQHDDQARIDPTTQENAPIPESIASDQSTFVEV
jgi:hypothetical protein